MRAIFIVVYYIRFGAFSEERKKPPKMGGLSLPSHSIWACVSQVACELGDFLLGENIVPHLKNFPKWQSDNHLITKDPIEDFLGVFTVFYLYLSTLDEPQDIFGVAFYLVSHNHLLQAHDVLVVVDFGTLDECLHKLLIHYYIPFSVELN